MELCQVPRRVISIWPTNRCARATTRQQQLTINGPGESSRIALPPRAAWCALGGCPRSRSLKNHTEGAPGPLLSGTGETPDLNGQEGGRPLIPDLRSLISAFVRGKRLLARKAGYEWPQNALRSLFCVLMGNSVVFASLIWSISRFYLLIKWPISRYSPPKIATYRANIPGVNDTPQANIWPGQRTK